MSVRTRVAPSPTGDPHVGTAYIALFNRVFAKQNQGQFILRIEDTDQVRSSAESERRILDAFNWLGLSWDEGPDVGGAFGPYRQSERTELYRSKVKYLLEQGHAFHCFCTPVRLDEMRAQQIKAKVKLGYDGCCLKLTAAAVQEKLKQNTPHVIRMKVPDAGSLKVQDLLRGNIEIAWSEVDMQVLLKADGLPTYHLANVVDDHEMNITHVIRGEEWINSLPKHQLLYQYFGWEAPVFCHLPLLRNPDKSKLSKRKNPTSILYYERMGYLPQALVNYLGRMGWSMPDEREQFSLQEMQACFDIKRVSLGAPVFDVEKLKWLNGQWLRHVCAEPEVLVQQLQRWAFKESYVYPMLQDAVSRVELLSELAPLLGFYFSGSLSLKPEDFQDRQLEPDQIKTLLQLGLWALEGLTTWDKASIQDVFSQLAEHAQLKLKVLMPMFFVAITGRASSVPVMNAMVLLGPDVSRMRLREAIDVLGGFSKKGLKLLEKSRLSSV